MRITYRSKNIKDYWESRWSKIDSDLPMTNVDAYPLNYAIKTTKDEKGKILEAGCGAGRILIYYHNQGRDIFGVDYIKVAIEKLKDVDSSLKVEVGDITNLKFKDESFKYVLAFGLYHGLEFGLEKSIKETFRIIEYGGSVCASFRADNIQTKLVDWLTQYRSGNKISKNSSEFHKMNLTYSEFRNLFESAGFTVEAIEPVENMPLLYKFAFFRDQKHKSFNENLARVEGYKLSWFGQLLQNFLMKFFPNQFCNIFVLIAHKDR